MTDQELIWSKVKGFNDSDSSFFEIARLLYQYQYSNNRLFKQYVDLLNRQPEVVSDINEFAFLPIEYFKNQAIITGDWKPDQYFESSATTSQQTSKHYYRDDLAYLENAIKSFETGFGDLSNYVVIGLLPAYLERKHSSLVAMANAFIEKSIYPESGFYLNEYRSLSDLLARMRHSQTKVLVIGVSFALLDLAEQFPGDYSHVMFMETGGMKGRRKELIRNDLHDQLKKGFQVEHIYSEYGMTELLSQAYMDASGRFKPAATMSVVISEINDPFQTLIGETGRINVIDLMNVDSCAFIQTSDLGKVYADGSFDVLGRLDNSDIRGCNLMVL